jgi:hypothetical protein
MQVTVKFDDTENSYEIDIFKLTTLLGVSEEQIKQAVYQTLSQT